MIIVFVVKYEKLFNDDSAYGACVWARRPSQPALRSLLRWLRFSMGTGSPNAQTPSQCHCSMVGSRIPKGKPPPSVWRTWSSPNRCSRGKNKRHIHTQTTKTETTVSVETEKTTTQEQDSTTRFEMNEVANTTDEDQRFEGRIKEVLPG